MGKKKKIHKIHRLAHYNKNFLNVHYCSCNKKLQSERGKITLVTAQLFQTVGLQSFKNSIQNNMGKK